MDNWYCVDNINITYMYGVLDEHNRVGNVKAEVQRLQDGSWGWRASNFTSIIPYGAGSEPSRELAQQAAEKFLRGE